MLKLKLNEKELMSLAMSLTHFGATLQHGRDGVDSPSANVPYIFFKDYHCISDELRNFLNGDKELVKVWVNNMLIDISSIIAKVNTEIEKAQNKPVPKIH